MAPGHSGAMATQTPTLQNWLSIGFLGVIWGGTFMVTALALEGYPPLTVACARTTLGALSMLALVFAAGRPMPRGASTWAFLFVLGVMNTALPFSLLSWGIQYVPSAFAGISMAALPLFILPLAHFFSDEPLNLRRFIGVIIGFCGALVLIGPGLFDPGSASRPLAQLACLGAGLCYAISSIMIRRAPPMDGAALSAANLMCGSLVLLPAMLIHDGLPHWAGITPGTAILFLGLVPTALATLIRTQVIRTAGSVFMTLVNFQVPLWSMLLGATVLGEELPGRFFAALLLILTGLAVGQWNSLRRALGRG